MLAFVKLGGSLITDKQRENTFLPQAMSQIAAEIAQALSASPDLRLVIGHGSGSFGHFAARMHGTARGVTSSEGWRGFAAVAAAARDLNHLVLHSLRDAGVPAMAFQPSAALMSDHRSIVYYETAPIAAALEHGLVPLVHGDVAFDKAQGGAIISTETVFFYLAQHLPAQHIVLLGEVPGVLDAHGAVIPEITPANVTEIESALGGSSGVDVTGGMETKVRDMLRLAEMLPYLRIHVASGHTPGLLARLLQGEVVTGTSLHAGR